MTHKMDRWCHQQGLACGRTVNVPRRNWWKSAVCWQLNIDEGQNSCRGETWTRELSWTTPRLCLAPFILGNSCLFCNDCVVIFLVLKVIVIGDIVGLWSFPEGRVPVIKCSTTNCLCVMNPKGAKAMIC